jgi:ubiquinone/menaquinone biosynthesis C-methylase UbiE
MKVIDYSKIAESYDKNQNRHNILKDVLIEELFVSDNNDFTVLDLSCGTGIYLKKQIEEYPKSKYNIKWLGIDKSEDMLRIAKSKNLDANLIKADVIDIPLENNSVNYIVNRFAFHHYIDKEKVAKEMYRILRQNGKLRIENTIPEYKRYSWIYKYFPASIELDNERATDVHGYYKYFENSGFKIDIKINISIKKYLYQDIIEKVKNRDNSTLHLITEDEYIIGLNKLEEDSKINESIIGDFVLMDIYGIKM